MVWTQRGCNGEVKCKIKRRQKRGWSGKAWSAWWPLGKDWPVSRFLPISRFQPGGFLPKLTLNDTEIMRGSHFRPSVPLARPHRASLGIDCRNHCSHQHHHLNQNHSTFVEVEQGNQHSHHLNSAVPVPF